MATMLVGVTGRGAPDPASAVVVVVSVVSGRPTVLTVR